MTLPQITREPTHVANDHPAGPVVVHHVHLITIVDLLAEAFVAKLAAANDNNPPIGE